VHTTETEPVSRATDEPFGEWYAARWPAAHRLAHRLLGDGVLAEDIASDTLLRVWERWQIAGVPALPDAYLARAIRNAVAATYRRRDRDRALLRRIDPPGPAEDHGAALVDRAEADAVLRRLPVAERQTLQLFHLDDLSAEEVARRMGVQPATVRSRLHRGRRRLATTA
jgi:RNA polymerase sigma factor (sigma-70 family)